MTSTSNAELRVTPLQARGRTRRDRPWWSRRRSSSGAPARLPPRTSRRSGPEPCARIFSPTSTPTETGRRVVDLQRSVDRPWPGSCHSSSASPFSPKADDRDVHIAVGPGGFDEKRDDSGVDGVEVQELHRLGPCGFHLRDRRVTGAAWWARSARITLALGVAQVLLADGKGRSPRCRQEAGWSAGFRWRRSCVG